MPKYPFLSAEWVDEARRIYAEAGPVLGSGGEPASVKVNLVVSEVPFSSEPVNAHLDTTGGGVAIGTGHVPEPDVTVSTDYLTARTLLVGGDVQAVMLAFLSGRLRVDGNLSKLLDPKSGIWPSSPPPVGGDEPYAANLTTQTALSFGAPLGVQLASRLQEITE